METTRAEKGQNEMQPHIRVRPILWKRNRFTAFREKKEEKATFEMATTLRANSSTKEPFDLMTST